MALEHRGFLEGGGLQFFVANRAATASLVVIVKKYSPNLFQPRHPVEWLAAWVSADEPPFLQLVTKKIQWTGKPVLPLENLYVLELQAKMISCPEEKKSFSSGNFCDVLDLDAQEYLGTGEA